MSEIKNKSRWNRAHVFKRKKSSKLVGHPVYVYAKSKRDYKYLLFTHTPEKGKEGDYEKMKYNIDPEDKQRATYVKKRYGISRQDQFLEPEKKYRIHDVDKPLINRLKK